MADNNRKPQPLVSNQPVVNSDGTPTQYFIRWAQARQLAIGDSLTLDDLTAFLADHELQAGVGITITPDGNIASDPTIALHADLGDLLDVDFSTPPTDGQTIVYDAASATWKPGAGGGGGAGAPPTVRGHALYHFNADNINANFPAGTVVGDVCVVATNHAYAVNNPAGWTVLSNLPGSNTNGAAFTKILDAGDIAAGYITVTYAGPFDGVIGLISYAGSSVLGVTLGAHVRNSNPTGNDMLASGAMFATDALFTYGGSRGNGPVTFAISTLDQGANSGSASGAVGQYQPTFAGSYNETISFADDSGGNYGVLVVVHGTPGGGGGSGAAAFLQFGVVGGVVTVNHSKNIASVTRTAAGFFDIVFTTPMTDAFYAMNGMAKFPTAGDNIGAVMTISRQGALTSAGFTLQVMYNDQLAFDPEYCSMMIYDLATM